MEGAGFVVGMGLGLVGRGVTGWWVVGEGFGVVRRAFFGAEADGAGTAEEADGAGTAEEADGAGTAEEADGAGVAEEADGRDGAGVAATRSGPCALNNASTVVTPPAHSAPIATAAPATRTPVGTRRRGFSCGWMAVGRYQGGRLGGGGVTGSHSPHDPRGARSDR